MMTLSLSSLRLNCSTPPRLVGPGGRGTTEEVRFELTRPLRAYRFSRPAHSTALPLLRGVPVRLSKSDESATSGPFSGLIGEPSSSDELDPFSAPSFTLLCLAAPATRKRTDTNSPPP